MKHIEEFEEFKLDRLEDVLAEVEKELFNELSKLFFNEFSDYYKHRFEYEDDLAYLKVWIIKQYNSLEKYSIMYFTRDVAKHYYIVKFFVDLESRKFDKINKERNDENV